MFGLKKEGNTYIFRVVSDSDSLYLNLYRGNVRVKRIPFDAEMRVGDVWTLRTEENLDGFSYAYEAEGRVFSDPNGSVFTGRTHFGRLKDGVKLLKTPIGEAIPEESEAWEKDRPLGIPYEDSIIYRLHVRGFTEDKSSGLDAAIRGSFAGIIEKIPYLKELGVNAVELMPPYEFNEVMLLKCADDSPRYPVGNQAFGRTGTSAGHRAGIHAGADGNMGADFASGSNADSSSKAGANAGDTNYNAGINTNETMGTSPNNAAGTVGQRQEAGKAEAPRPRVIPTGRINYWGFTEDALHLAPKAAYTSIGGNPKEEFQRLVQTLHEAGMEIIVDLYFTETALPDYINTVIRYWRVAFHVDGVHLIGNVPRQVIIRDPYLSRFKIWADSWDGTEKKGKVRYLAEYNDGFQNDMRRILKGDENMVRTLQDRIRQNPAGHASVQYISNEAGFTLMDVLSYDRKHNEDNGESNRDGTDYNFSWNCGEEGSSRRKGVKLLRRKMYRNAMMLLLLSQGTPLLNAGDEFGRTKGGNNNSYCQDNNVNWLNWRLLSKNQDLFEFTKKLISFRKSHPVFHQREALRGLDYRSKGIPDISFHGENAWQVGYENFRRQLAVMYAGDYAQDDTFLVLYNFHWETHLFRLPRAKTGMEWKVVMDSSMEECNGILGSGEEISLPEGTCRVNPRSIVVLQAFKEKTKPRRKSGKSEKAEKARKVSPGIREEQKSGTGISG